MVNSTFFSKLFQPGQIGKLKIRNRIVMLPMAGYFSGVNSEVTDRTIADYVERAKGEVGLIMVGANGVMPITKPIHATYLNLSEDRLLPGHYHLVEAVHVHGAKIGIQLIHQGPEVTWAQYGGEQPPSASSIQQFDVSGSPLAQPRPMTRAEIYQVIDLFVNAAVRAKRVGYDLVEVHGAHGYLINAFMSPAMNKRTDEYGGSLENRMRFPVEIIKAIHKAFSTKPQKFS